MTAVIFAAVLGALWVAHSVGDHWVQTHEQALEKGLPGWPGRVRCIQHVASLACTKLVALAVVVVVTGLELHVGAVAAGLLVDGISHYLIDRRTLLAELAERIGKADFYRMGAGHLGSGAYALDQSSHHLFLFAAALIIAGGSA